MSTKNGLLEWLRGHGCVECIYTTLLAGCSSSLSLVPNTYLPGCRQHHTTLPQTATLMPIVAPPHSIRSSPQPSPEVPIRGLPRTLRNIRLLGTIACVPPGQRRRFRIALQARSTNGPDSVTNTIGIEGCRFTKVYSGGKRALEICAGAEGRFYVSTRGPTQRVML